MKIFHSPIKKIKIFTLKQENHSHPYRIYVLLLPGLGRGMFYFCIFPSSSRRNDRAPRPEDGVKWKTGSGRSQSYVEGSVGGLVLLTPWKIYTFGCSSVAAFCIFVFEWSFYCAWVCVIWRMTLFSVRIR